MQFVPAPNRKGIVPAFSQCQNRAIQSGACLIGAILINPCKARPCGLRRMLQMSQRRLIVYESDYTTHYPDAENDRGHSRRVCGPYQARVARSHAMF